MANEVVHEISILDKTYSLERAKLREWIKLESLHNQVIESAKRRDVEAFSDAICSYVLSFVGVDVEELPWWEVAFAFVDCLDINMPSLDLPIFQSKHEKVEEAPWKYDGREWYAWLHTLASQYGWSIEYIAELDIDDAFALSQETAIEDQLDKEWTYSLSEVAYPYDESSKKHSYKPLKRPFWMLGIDPDEPLPTVKIPKHMMPVGLIIKSDGSKNIVN